MRSRYAVEWREADGPSVHGTLETLPLGFRFTPSGQSESPEEVHFEDIAALRVGISPDRALLIDRRAGATIRVTGAAEPALASVLLEDVSKLALGGGMRPRRLVVVVPLKEGEVDTARRLLEQGPPFDPERVGLERHELFLTSSEAIFLFETPIGDAALKDVFEAPELWSAAPAWRDVIGGVPRVAEVVYAWERGRLEPAE